jgi:hypothetical protein
MSRQTLYKSLLFSALLPWIPMQGAVEYQEGQSNPNNIQVVPVEPTPEPDDIAIRIQYPSEGRVEKKNPVRVEMRIDWFPLGVDTDLPRKDEIFDSKSGQCLHVFVDDQDYFTVCEALFDAVDDHDEYFDQIAEFDIPFSLTPGLHVIRAFPCRSFGESLKKPKNSVAKTFYFEKKDSKTFDLNQPYLTYNEPQGSFEDPNKPILLDFYINNCTLSKDGYKVRLTIDGANQRFLYDWVPYYIYGLGKGEHTIRLELISPQNTPVAGPFNDVQKKFTIQ